MTRRSLLAAAALMGKPSSVVVIAHRAEHLQNPENSLAGIAAAIKLGVDYVEVDVRTTGDGALVLMHDATVDRMTDGTGVVAQMTSQQISGLHLKGGGKVPLFGEVLDLLRPSHTGVYLDSKQITATDIVRALKEHRMLDRAVIYGRMSLLKELAALGPLPKVMPEAHSVEALRSSLAELKPRVVAFDHTDWRDDIIAVARQAGVDIYVDRLDAADNPQQWKEAILKGATGIQTDRPAALIEFLRGDARHQPGK